MNNKIGFMEAKALKLSLFLTSSSPIFHIISDTIKTLQIKRKSQPKRTAGNVLSSYSLISS
jgi:hypothetical protein